MLFPALSLFGLPAGPSAVLDLTADFAPLLVGLWVLLGLCVPGLGVALATHDTWQESRQVANVDAARSRVGSSSSRP